MNAIGCPMTAALREASAVKKRFNGDHILA